MNERTYQDVKEDTGNKGGRSSMGVVSDEEAGVEIQADGNFDANRTQMGQGLRAEPSSIDSAVDAHDPGGRADVYTTRQEADQGTMSTNSDRGTNGHQTGGSAPDSDSDGVHATLLSTEKADSLSRRWSDIQGTFVDEPQTAVRSADGLVSEVIQELSQRFAQERQSLEKQWSGGGDVSTEDLRMALRHYRDFFQRLLAA